MIPRLFVTNFNRNFTGVSATAANVVRVQAKRHDLSLVGQPLPNCPAPIEPAQARYGSRGVTPFAIWHVRRNTEMRAAIFARDVLRLPIKIVFTSAAQRRHSAVPRWLISRMDAVIATTDAAATHVPNVRAVVPHGVDTDMFTPAKKRWVAWGKTGFGGQKGIATIGRIRPEKGTDVFVDAMLRLLPQQPDSTALIIGKATREHQSFLDGLKVKVARTGLNERILFIGEVPAAELPALMQSLSLIMQMPRYEGFGMVPLEGMASGVPFVATDAGSYRAFSDEGRTGTIVQDATDASDAAAKILHSNHEAMAAHARIIAQTCFSSEQEADGIDAVYQMLLTET
jgi:mannosyltransferase